MGHGRNLVLLGHWRSVTGGQGLDDEKAALLMTEMVQGVFKD